MPPSPAETAGPTLCPHRSLLCLTCNTQLCVGRLLERQAWAQFISFPQGLASTCCVVASGTRERAASGACSPWDPLGSRRAGRLRVRTQASIRFSQGASYWGLGPGTSTPLGDQRLCTEPRPQYQVFPRFPGHRPLEAAPATFQTPATSQAQELCVAGGHPACRPVPTHRVFPASFSPTSQLPKQPGELKKWSGIPKECSWSRGSLRGASCVGPRKCKARRARDTCPVQDRALSQ